MKFQHLSNNRAVALITTLLLVSAITLVTISVLTISQNEAQISGSRISNTRADLAERAAFEEAKNLLNSLTSNDRYLVSSTMHGGDSNNAGMRYTFISTPESGSVTHVPLFAGGDVRSQSVPNFDNTDTASLARSPAGKPDRGTLQGTISRNIETFGLTHLNENGEMISESRFPETVLIDMPVQPDEKFRMRYTWWAEDLEGFPNIDVVGGWTDHYGDASGDLALDFIRPGYSANDARTLPAEAIEGGQRIPFPETANFAWQFPKSFRGQKFTGQIAPGLSPREIILQPWPTAGIPLQQHPFARTPRLTSARHWLSSGGAYTNTTALKREHRFMVGLHSYLHVPHIPYNHSYPDEGQPRHNLNSLISNRAVSRLTGSGGLAEIISRNLSAFETRRGGLPSDKSYLGTIAANAIDYVDPDSAPSSPDDTVNEGDYQFRGVDNYCPLNEFFVHFHYDGYSSTDIGIVNDLTFSFYADFYGEFWNTSDQPVLMRNMLLEFEFLDDLGFKYSSFVNRRARITKDNIIPVEAGETALTDPSDSKLIPPNQYNVHYFGRVRWKVSVSLDGIPDFEVPTVQDLQAFSSRKSSARATYRLTIPDLTGNPFLVDSCGRPDPLTPGATAPPPGDSKHGFFFNRHRGVLTRNRPFFRVAAGNLGMMRKEGSAPKMSGSHLGDPWMTYYARSTVDNAGNRETEYKNRATPGFRNFDHSKVNDSDRTNVIKDQTRVRDWPDRGYDNEISTNSHPDDNSELPSDFNPPPAPPVRFDPNRAPFRISNEGVYFSVSELGNLHDPAMWSSVPLNLVGPGSLSIRYDPFSNPPQYFRDFPEQFRGTLVDPVSVAKHSLWGGGNTLRIGRPEHPLFDQPGQRASQLLDLFQVGHPGTNLNSSDGNPLSLYEHYDPRDHQPPPAAPDAALAKKEPFNRIYDERLHAEGIFQQRLGHLNINSAPTVFEIETLLRGPFSSAGILVEQNSHRTPFYVSAASANSLANALKPEAIPVIARSLYEARPFYSPSHLARVLSELIRITDALPAHHNDAEAEETFARVFNTTTFSSRHFRIYTYAEVLPRNSDTVISRSRKIYEVFFEPEHDSSGNITGIRSRILSIRDL